jgi:hypothetical protein
MTKTFTSVLSAIIFVTASCTATLAYKPWTPFEVQQHLSRMDKEAQNLGCNPDDKGIWPEKSVVEKTLRGRAEIESMEAGQDPASPEAKLYAEGLIARCLYRVAKHTGDVETAQQALKVLRAELDGLLQKHYPGQTPDGSTAAKTDADRAAKAREEEANKEMEEWKKNARPGKNDDSCESVGGDGGGRECNKVSKPKKEVKTSASTDFEDEPEEWGEEVDLKHSLNYSFLENYRKRYNVSMHGVEDPHTYHGRCGDHGKPCAREEEAEETRLLRWMRETLRKNSGVAKEAPGQKRSVCPPGTSIGYCDPAKELTARSKAGGNKAEYWRTYSKDEKGHILVCNNNVQNTCIYWWVEQDWRVSGGAN